MDNSHYGSFFACYTFIPVHFILFYSVVAIESIWEFFLTIMSIKCQNIYYRSRKPLSIR